MKWIPKLISLVLLWGTVVATIIYIDPELLKDIIIPELYLPFVILLLISLWYTLAIFIKSAWKSFVMSLTMILMVVLSILKIMHIGLAIVILLTLGIESWYIYMSDEKINRTNEQKDRRASL